jgi:hypothetical protein
MEIYGKLHTLTFPLGKDPLILTEYEAGLASGHGGKEINGCTQSYKNAHIITPLTTV